MKFIIHICFVIALTVFILPVAAQSATQITGTVTAKSGDSVKVEFKPHKTTGPKVGDLVSFKKTMQGIELDAGQGEITKIGTDFVWVNIPKKGRANLKMTGIIHATGTRLRMTVQAKGAPTMHRCDELTGDPFDDQRIGPSVDYYKVDAGQAIVACEDAVKKYPKTGRFLFQLGKAYSVDKQYEKAIRYYRQATEQDYAAAQSNLGALYNRGAGVSKDLTEAVKWYRMAAKQGHPLAQYNLGQLYKAGNGVPKNITEGVKWYRKAAEWGFAVAQYKLGKMYRNGDGVVKDNVEAVKWYRKAADQGYGSAQVNLGVLYYTGQGVSQNYAEALKLFRMAAKQGDVTAQANLGHMYRAGEGVSKDDTEAFKWLRKAAEQGHATSQNNIGVMYEYGKGISKNKVEALSWYRKAAAQNNKKAKKALERLGNEL